MNHKWGLVGHSDAGQTHDPLVDQAQQAQAHKKPIKRRSADHARISLFLVAAENRD